MLDMIRAVPVPFRDVQDFDARTAAYYASLQELEQRLRQLSTEYGIQEEAVPERRKREDQGGLIELTDYLLIEDV